MPTSLASLALTNEGLRASAAGFSKVRTSSRSRLSTVARNIADLCGFSQGPNLSQKMRGSSDLSFLLSLYLLRNFGPRSFICRAVSRRLAKNVARSEIAAAGSKPGNSAENRQKPDIPT
jgi:hypothetical protein